MPRVAGPFVMGKFLPINQNQSLYSLLGTTYGGDGRTSFALPDLRGRAPMHVGNGHREGQKSGEETHTLAANEMPQHKHTIQATSTVANQNDPTGNLLATSGQIYRDAGPLVSMKTGTMLNVGGGQAHENMQPYLAVNFCIALQGLFPSRN